MKTLPRHFGLGMVLTVAGCVAGPDHVRPSPPDALALEQGAFLRAGDSGSEAPAERWWQGLGDPVLSDLIEKGLAQSPSLEAAEARLRQARAAIAGSRAALLPALSSSVTYVYADLPNQAFGIGSGQNELFNVGFDAQWEADLWGGKARAVDRSRAQAAEAEAMLADARVSLASEIARTYVALRARQASLTLLERREEVETRLAELSQTRLSGGTGTRQEVAMARQALTRTAGEKAAMAAEIAVLLDGLAVLTGGAPGTIENLPLTAVPLPPAEVEIGDPAAMLARRPDIRAAESRLAAATAGIGEAQARALPGISLIGLIGIGGTSIGDVFDTSQLSALAIPRLTWNFLDFGRNRAALRGAEAGRDAALADYRAQVLAALQDAEAALARFGAARIGYGQASEAMRLGDEAAELQQLRANAGTVSRGDAMSAMARAIDARIARANRQADLTLSWIALAKALGLGWQAEPVSGG